MKSNKVTSILLLLIFVCTSTALLNENFILPYNIQNLLRSSSIFAIIGIGAVFVIVTGGIDLSIGSVICIIGCSMAMLINAWTKHPPANNLQYCLWMVSADLILLVAFAEFVPWFANRKTFFTRGKSWKFLILGIGIVAGIGGFVAPQFASQAAIRGVAQIEPGQVLKLDVDGKNFVADDGKLTVQSDGSWTLNFQPGDDLPDRPYAVTASTQLADGSSVKIENRVTVPWVTLICCLFLAFLVSIHIGLFQGLLITKLNLQPFVVTLCGLLIFRGLARWMTADETQGLGNGYDESLRLLALGKPLNASTVILIIGIVLIAYAIFRWIMPSASGSSQSKIRNAMVLVGAIMLTAIGGSAFSSSGILGVAVEDLPAMLMRWCAWGLLPVIGLIAFQYWNHEFRQTKQISPAYKNWLWQLLFASSGLVISIVLMYFIKRWIGEESVSLKGADRVTILKVVSVFGGMTLLLFFASRFSKTVIQHLRDTGGTLIMAAGFFACLWLVGNTSLPKTIVQTPFIVMTVVAIFAAILLNKTTYGRYLFAIGRNETAAKYSGIDTDSIKVMAYTLCAACAGIGSILFTLDSNSVSPSAFGTFYELYAIAAAVLGGCSLRGGEGTIIGVIIGASILRVLYNAPDMIGIPSQLEFFMIGIIILIGAIVDEIVRRIAAKRKTMELAKTQLP